jgi:hypothetical protein
MATALATTCSPHVSTAERNHGEWQDFFMPEARAHVAHRQELGDYVANPDRAARIYASFAAFDALMKGGAHRVLDFERARSIAEIMAKLPTGIPERFQVTTEAETLEAAE